MLFITYNFSAEDPLMISSPYSTLTRRGTAPSGARRRTPPDARIPLQVERELRACLDNRCQEAPPSQEPSSQAPPPRSMAQAVDGVISAVDGVIDAATSPIADRDPVVEELVSPVDKRPNQGLLLD